MNLRKLRKHLHIGRKLKVYRAHRLIKSYKDCDTFVETGTHKGNTIDAVKDLFKKITSIELDDYRYIRAKERFKDYEHITILQGDSGELIPPKADLYWLDAHTPDNCPLIAELKRIKDYKVILIDDASFFTRKRPNYPTLIEISQAIEYKSFNIKGDIICIEGREK